MLFKIGLFWNPEQLLPVSKVSKLCRAIRHVATFPFAKNSKLRGKEISRYVWNSSTVMVVKFQIYQNKIISKVPEYHQFCEPEK